MAGRRRAGERRVRELLTLRYRARSAATPEAAWRLLAQPGCWSRWAPHVRGAWGLGTPEVQPGRHGAVMLGGALPVPVRITRVDPGRRWDWRVGWVDMRHEVAACPGGCEITITLAASPPLERGLGVSYGPVIALLLRNLARVAAQPV